MKLLSRFLGIAGAVLLVGSALLSCSKEQEFVPALELNTDYYPLAINTQRTFAVADTAWSSGRATVTNYQFREAVVDTFRDASGHKSYRVIRAKRVPPATAWQNDSVYVLTPTAQTVTLLRDNRRTVELIFPVREDRGWNLNAYNASSNNASTNDTITDVTRRYHRVGKPLTIRTKVYDKTLITLNEGSAADSNAYYLTQYQQVFAKGVGPVLRRQRRYYFCDSQDPNCQPSPTYIFLGNSRHQTLIDYGPL
jgi:hypothetical protein